MVESIHNLASVTCGLYTQSSPDGSAIYLQANHFNDFGEMEDFIKPNLILNRKNESHLLFPGDILFAAKGNKNFAASITNKMGPCVASSIFLVLRVNGTARKKLIPEFLVWFLNHPNTQSKLKSKAIGSALSSISKKVLEEMELELPDLHTQQCILIIDELRKKEKKLKLQIETLKEQQVQRLLINKTNTKKIFHE
jgi:restriction endonuclease S subunit